MNIPPHIRKILEEIKGSGYEAFVVGGCVRDLLMKKEPKDWDITTNALPNQILSIFPQAKYENDFGTVLLPFRSEPEVRGEKGALKDVVEITTYRSEKGYSDRRHPDEIRFETELNKDLERRDFTVNALALNPLEEVEIVDLFGGQKDIKEKILRAVGEPTDRFKEDALRMMRAVRFSAQLDFELEPKTQRAIVK